MANDLFESLKRAATSFNIVVEEPQWVEVPNPRSAADYNNGIKSDIDPKVCKIVCVVIFNPDFKKGVKSFLDKGGVPSQFITTKKLGGPKGIPMGVLSNLLKQMNAKMRLDLYRLNVPHFRNTMVIGIDLVMSGSSKLIGCSATSNKNLTQCFTKMYKQKLPKIT
jgi:hypothetical protein